MRRIGSADEIERKRKRNVQIFSMFLLGIMVLSSLGYAFFSNPNVGTAGSGGEYTGVRQLGDKWVFGSSDKPIALTYSPEDVKNITVQSISGISAFVSEPLFIDSTDATITTEIAGALQYYASRMQEACYGSCERDLPEKTCEQDNLIVWRQNSANKVSQQDKCVFIDGDLRAVDAYIYNLFGILPS